MVNVLLNHALLMLETITQKMILSWIRDGSSNLLVF